MVLMTRSGASSTVTGAIRSVISALAGSCPGCIRAAPTDSAPSPLSFTKFRRFTAERVAVLITFPVIARGSDEAFAAHARRPADGTQHRTARLPNGRLPATVYATPVVRDRRRFQTRIRVVAAAVHAP